MTPIVWIGPAIIWFGVGDRPIEFLIANVSIFAVLINTAEIVAGNDGIGYLICSSRVYFEFDRMFASIATLGAMGLLADRLLVIAQRTLLRRYRGTGH